ncbi:MAG: type II toxin-antitoxin system prevent-host-death family antitoxin [Bryobacteraceae bacterium]|nr:type II toxin-antitoxin system prevent-host-death family antitoxin [Bryobacteraceae bacterium]
MKHEIAAGDFKAKCLALLDEVRDEQKTLVITKRGIPVARLVPIAPVAKSYGGSLRGTVRIHGDLFSAGEKWDAEQDA